MNKAKPTIAVPIISAVVARRFVHAPALVAIAIVKVRNVFLAAGPDERPARFHFVYDGGEKAVSIRDRMELNRKVPARPRPGPRQVAMRAADCV
jgi:hypothetical protein